MKSHLQSDGKSRESTWIGHPFHLAFPHGAGGRPLLHVAEKCLQNRPGTGSYHLYPAIGEIAHVSLQAVSTGFGLSEKTKAHSLDPATDQGLDANFTAQTGLSSTLVFVGKVVEIEYLY